MISKYNKIISLLILALSFSQTVEISSAMEDRVDIESLKHRLEMNHLYDRDNGFKPLSYAEFIELQEKGLITNEQSEQLIDYAYKEFNPFLFRKSNKHINPESYVLNFLWIHAKKQSFSEECHLFGEDDEKFNDKILNPILSWQKKQPQAYINFWYDDQMVNGNESIIETTQRKLLESGVCLDRLAFKSMRTIDTVKKYERVFNENIPVHLRADLAKIMTAQFVMDNYTNVDYIINIDLDIAAITAEQLFDERTLVILDNLGYVFATSAIFYDKGTEENSFIMLNKNLARDSHRKNMIEETIKKIDGYIDFYDNKYLALEDDAYASQLAYNAYFDFFKPEMKKKSGIPGKFLKGKSMIFPGSTFGLNSYTNNEIEYLKPFLM